MKIFLWILAIIILYLLLELGIFYYKYNHLPNLTPPDQSTKTFGNGAELKYIAAGDSTAVGEGASSLEKTYPYQVANYFAKDHTVTYKNIAVVGYKTQDVLDKQVEQIIAFNPDVITISMGPNDATHLVSSSKVLQNYKTIIQKLEQGTTAKIYITDVANFNGANILPWFYIKLIEFRSSRQNSEILKLGDERVKIVNIHDFGWDQELYKDRSKTYAADHFHPNDLGYQNWTKAFLDKLQNP
jgi:lysophospholipase L1-like esterase